MACQILVSNKAGVKGEIVSLVDNESLWTEKETLTRWIEKNPNKLLSEYHRNFTLIKITDKDVIDLSYITSATIIDDNPVNKYYFIEPSVESELWSELFTTGQISLPWTDVVPYLIERT
tara:strand:- start:12008 stop:12364 length:357 start_codon:yes stop_codon:yes gene_type:complete